MVNTLCACPSVHLHLSFTCWLVRASRTGPFQVGQCQLLAHYDCTPPKDLTFNGGEPTPCLTFSHATCVVHSFSQLFHDQTNQKKEEGYLETMRNNEKGLRISFVFFFFSRNGLPPRFQWNWHKEEMAIFETTRFFGVVIAVYLSIRILSLLLVFPKTTIMKINEKYGIANVVTRQ